MCCVNYFTPFFFENGFNRTGSRVRGFDLQEKQHGGRLGVAHFRFEAADVHERQSLCKTCRDKFATSCGNTTILYWQLKDHHRHLYEKCITKRSGEKSSNCIQVDCKTVGLFFGIVEFCFINNIAFFKKLFVFYLTFFLKLKTKIFCATLFLKL